MNLQQVMERLSSASNNVSPDSRSKSHSDLKRAYRELMTKSVDYNGSPRKSPVVSKSVIGDYEPTGREPRFGQSPRDSVSSVKKFKPAEFEKGLKEQLKEMLNARRSPLQYARLANSQSMAAFDKPYQANNNGEKQSLKSYVSR